MNDLEGASRPFNGPTKFFVVVFYRAFCANTDYHSHDMNRIVCVLLDRGDADNMRDRLTKEAEEFLATCTLLNEQCRVAIDLLPVLLFDQPVPLGSLRLNEQRSIQMMPLLDKRDQLIAAYADKMLDYRWRYNDVFDAVFWQGTIWSYMIREAFDDPSEPVL